LNVTVIVVDINEAMEPWGKILCGRGGAGMQAQLRGMTMVMVLSFVKTEHAEPTEPDDYLYVVGVVVRRSVVVVVVGDGEEGQRAGWVAM
jgi:hypothetical protein